MGILIGSTGFVGGHLARSHPFEVQVHRPTLPNIAGLETDLLVCAGLPAEKWRANKEPAADWANMAELAQALATVTAQRAVLVSTIDVYQPAVDVDERSPGQFNGQGAYGAHRAWFEAFFRSQFPEALLLRLPGLFAPDLRKNLIYDLLHGRSDQWVGVNPSSTFQFFDVAKTWDIISWAQTSGISLLNVSSEPVTAQDVADLFGVTLTATSAQARYDMRSIHADAFGGSDGYLFSRQSVLAGIAGLREAGRQR